MQIDLDLENALENPPEFDVSVFIQRKFDGLEADMEQSNDAFSQRLSGIDVELSEIKYAVYASATTITGLLLVIIYKVW